MKHIKNIQVKKLIFSLYALSMSFHAFSQYSSIFDFDEPIGQHPMGSLTYDGAYLYGTTFTGGTSTSCLGDNCGVIFKVLPDGSGYTVLHNFKESDGSLPQGSLIIIDDYLYGMTYKGGMHGKGVIFKMKTNGTAYEKILNFNGTNGSFPKGSFIYDGSFLYGMTLLGGENDYGVIFKIMPDGTNYTKLLDFDAWVTGNGPYADLISDGTFLYGMTWGGGAYDHGVIFKIMPDGTGYTKLLDFNNEQGINPWGSLIFDSIYLYGMTYLGGDDDFGVIFKIKPDGTDYIKLHDFDDDNGSHPEGTLLLHDAYLYGLTHWGGTTGDCPYECGVLFKINTDGTGFSNLHNFGHSIGSDPKSELISIPPFLYGMTYQGGENARGTIFKYDLNGELVEENSESINVYPNPCTSSFTITGTSSAGYITLYDVSAREILRMQTLNSETGVNIEALSTGCYFLQYADEENKIFRMALLKL